MTSFDAASVAAAAGRVRDRIADAGGDPDAVTVLAVTKGHPLEAVRVAAEVGLTDVGENYAQELVDKDDRFDGAVRWHFVGRLQSNKVRLLAGRVSCWQTIDRPSLVAELARRDPGATAMVQVDISGEPQKGGCAPEDVPDLVARASDAGIEVVGLMGVAAAGPPEVARRQFASLRRLADDLGLEQRSMGMSGDLEQAVAEGSTMVRIGSALFGARPPR